MGISRRTKNYEEWKLLNERKKVKEKKREREMSRYLGHRARGAWGY